ncbi:MAG: hypothetical protein Fur0027_17680 [Raineya sp.]
MQGSLRSGVNTVKISRGGALYVAGSYEGTHDLGNGNVLQPLLSNVTPCPPPCFPKLDAFVAKYLPNGTCQWAVRIGGNLNDEIYAIDIDNDGNVYVAGTAGDNNTQNVQFYSHNVVIPNVLATNINSNLGFIAKYNTSGQLLWRQEGKSGESVRVLDVEGTFAYVSGDNMQLHRFNISNGIRDNSFSRLMASGGIPKGIRVINNMLYVTGQFSGSSNFGSGASFNSANGNHFALRYNISGNNTSLAWKKQFNIETEGIDFNSGRAYVVAENAIFAYEATTGADVSGWLPKAINGAKGQAVISKFGLGIITVGFMGTQNVDFGNGFVLSAPTPTNPPGSPSILNGYYAEYAPDGTCLKAALIPISIADTDFVSGSINMALATNSSRIVIGGSFTGEANFNVCGGNLTLTTDLPFYNGFVANYSQNYAGFEQVNITPTGTSSGFICNNPKNYEITELQDATTYIWTSSNNLTLSNANTPVVTVSPNIGAGGEAWIECTIIVNNACYNNVSQTYRKNLWIGIPSDVFVPNGQAPYNYTFGRSMGIVNIPLESNGAERIGGTINGIPRQFNNGIEIDLANTPIGVYEYILLGRNDCGFSPNPTTIMVVIEEGIENDKISKFFPNPAKEALHIESKAKSYILYNKYSQKVIEGVLEDNSAKIRLQNIANDIYFLHLTYEDGNIERKQIIVSK